MQTGIQHATTFGSLLSTLQTAFLFWLALYPDYAHACSCAGASVESRIQQADAIFAAVIGERFDFDEIVSLDETDTTLTRSAIRYQTKYIWKGDPGESGLIFTNPDGASCGAGLKKQETYFIFAENTNLGLSTSLCSGNQLLKYALLERYLLGSPEASFAKPVLQDVTAESLLIDLSSDDSRLAANAAEALHQTGHHNDMLIYIQRNNWWCEAPQERINLLTDMLSKLGRRAVLLADPLDKLWYCDAEEVRAAWTYSLGIILNGQKLLASTLRGLADPSALVRSSAARSAHKITGPNRQVIRAYLVEMISGDQPDLRVSGIQGFDGFDDMQPAELQAVCEVDTSGVTEHFQQYADSYCRQYLRFNYQSLSTTEVGKQLINKHLNLRLK